MTVMVHMGKVLVLGQAFPPGNGKWVTWQLVCVPVWAELLPAARAPRVATYTRTAARRASPGQVMPADYLWYSQCVPELHEAVCF